MSTPADVHTLTGAYVLDALSPEERAQFAQHLALCVSCTQEVAELSEAAARLGSMVASTPPPQLRTRVMSAVAGSRQLPPTVYDVPPVEGVPRLSERRQRWLRRVTMTVAAAALVTAVVLGYQSALTNQELSRKLAAQQQLDDGYRALAAVLAAPDARVVTQAAGNGASMTVVTSASLGSAVLLPRGMPAPPPQHTYQLWVMRAGEARPAGFVALGEPAPPVVAQGVAPGDEIGVTLEPSGGSARPTTTPIMVIQM